MTQPSGTIIKDKIEDFNQILGKSVEFINNDYQHFIKTYRRDNYFKPIVALFTPHNLARILASHDDIPKYARFVLDEIHERSVETDVITAILAQKLHYSTIPLHLLMMTATPDIRIINLFSSNQIKIFNLEDMLLFPIEDIKRESLNFRSLDNIAQDETFNILRRMLSKQVKPGHILIFTSGNRRIKNISEQIHLHIKNLPQEIKLIRLNEKSMKHRNVFYENLNEQVKNDNYLYVLLMKYAGYLSQEEKEIAKNPIPDHPNVVKVIIATNAIESSITIDGLAAVIDCGIFNQPVLDKTKGISKLEESPISIQSQTQRRGRVGRKRNGICVQITVKNYPPVKLISPAIEKEDISSDILSLRKIGIRLENISNLPEPGINSVQMGRYLQELKSFGALNPHGDLTNKGDELQKFTSLLPFVSTSILEVSERFPNDQKNMAKITGSLIFHILSTTNLIIDPLTNGFRRNFNHESDVITLLTSLIEVMLKEGKRKFNLENFGFHSGNTFRLIGNIEQTAYNFLGESKESIWKDINAFVRSYKMIDFIQMILNQIGTHKKQWLSCRRAKYSTVSNVLNRYQFIYHGDSSLEENYSSVTEINLNVRPGATGFSTPGECYILQITKGDNDEYYGSIVHRKINVNETCHPLTFTVPLIMENQFTVPLIEAYLGEDTKLFRPFQKTKKHQETKYGGFICYPDQYDDSQSIISYAPIDVGSYNSQQLMREAILKALQLLQFTPRTILVRNDVLKAFVAITGYGSQNYSSRIIDYTDTKINPYHINKVTIDYMTKRLDEMNDVDGHLVIAMIGEKFFYSSDNEDFLGCPITWPTASSVFGTTSLFYSHLVVISDKKIPNATRLSWVDPSISVTYSDVDALVHIANTMYREVVSVYHNFDFLYSMTQEATCQVDGILPEFRGVITETNVHRPIGHMLDLYAMNCIKNDSLISDVNSKTFELTGNIQGQNLLKSIQAIKRIQKEIHVADDDLRKIIDFVQLNIQCVYNEINNLVARRKHYSDVWNQICKNPTTRSQVIQEQKEIKERTSHLYNVVNSNKAALLQYGISEEKLKDFLKIDAPFEILSINQLFVYPSFFKSVVKVDDVEFTINKMKSYRSDLDIEVLPKCELVIHHTTNCKLNRKQFEQQITYICNRFGNVVEKISEYKANNNNRFRGKINVSLNGGDFVIPFVGEVKRAIGFKDNVPLKIPFRIVPLCIRFRQNVIDAIEEWIRLNDLRIKKTGAIFIGNQQEIDKALDLLNNSNSKPKIPYKSFTIPGGISIPHVISLVNKNNRSLSNNKKWAVDKQSDLQTRFLIVPSDIDESQVNTFFNKIRRRTGVKPTKDEDILYDYLLCCGSEDAALSESRIPIYNKDGTYVCRNFCTNCAYDLILNTVGNLFDQEESQPRLDLILGNVEKIKPIPPIDEVESEQWPSIPFGQLLWCLISEPKLSSVTKTWFSAICYQAFHSFFEFCPDHPKILLRKKKHGILRCSKRDCKMYLCPNCRRWHKKGQCADIPDVPMGFRICPNCRRPIEKTQDCNHITCDCGKHFCYFCGWGPADDGKDVYRHMGREHGGCFNDPPDYRKMRGDNISDEEIEAFYRQYPKLKPLNYSQQRRRMRRF